VGQRDLGGEAGGLLSRRGCGGAGRGGGVVAPAAIAQERLLPHQLGARLVHGGGDVADRPAGGDADAGARELIGDRHADPAAPRQRLPQRDVAADRVDAGLLKERAGHRIGGAGQAVDAGLEHAIVDAGGAAHLGRRAIAGRDRGQVAGVVAARWPAPPPA
jgi:hypothetical protein